MKTLKQLCKPRPSVFDPSKRDTVLDITDLFKDTVVPEKFFEENFQTGGMKMLLQQAFRRFAGQNEQGVFVLSQAMGGGKTHNMLSLGLLAKHPEIRQKVMDEQHPNLGKVRVVGFTGRESDASLGIWGEIARQLGKQEAFNAYYSPLQAPGQTAWANLLQGEPLLILLDELPPYFENAKSKAIGNSDLAQVTTTALSNLLVAVGKPELSNVAVVISDLKATYEGGSEQLNRALGNLREEVGRSAMVLEPVGMNTDEVYHILRKRLFEELPGEAEIAEVAQGYAKAVKAAQQSDITREKPEQYAMRLRESYPFHFGIRDLWARFKENAGFQQTRGLIRLMRVLVSRLYDEQEGKAGEFYLIHAHDFDFNHSETLSQLNQINPKLAAAISHDVASKGDAEAEKIDAEQQNSSDARDAAKLLLIASLANVPGAAMGLNMYEIAAYLCAPNRDLSRLRNDALNALSTRAWYLHTDTQGRLFFKDTQNIVAKLKTTAESYTRESCYKELREYLKELFKITIKDCYQEVLPLPPPDGVEIGQDKVSLVICEPQPGGGLSEGYQQFYENLAYKNRVLFLTGIKDTHDTLLDNSASFKAIKNIIAEMQAEKVSANDPQLIMSQELLDKIRLRLLSALREAFTTFFYPHGDSGQLLKTDCIMDFTNNNFNGEQQIRKTLLERQKFTEDVSSDTFRKKCEARLFTQPFMPWSEVKKRAATNTQWQWHRPDALDKMRDELIHKAQWRESGNYVDRTPPPPPTAEVKVQQLKRDDDTGKVFLRLHANNGDTIYYEVGGKVTTASMKVADPKNFETEEIEVQFLCVDSTGKCPTGQAVTWKNTVTLKSRQYKNGDSTMAELRAAPPGAEIRYTTNGADPQHNGGLYDGDFAVPLATTYVLAVASKGGVQSQTHKLEIDKGPHPLALDLQNPVLWKHKFDLKNTAETYVFLDRLKKYEGFLRGPRFMVSSQEKGWVEFTSDERINLDAQQARDMIDWLRTTIEEGDVSLEVNDGIRFKSGQLLKDWEAETKITLIQEEILQ